MCPAHREAYVYFRPDVFEFRQFREHVSYSFLFEYLIVVRPDDSATLSGVFLVYFDAIVVLYEFIFSMSVIFLIQIHQSTKMRANGSGSSSYENGWEKNRPMLDIIIVVGTLRRLYAENSFCAAIS